MGRLVHTGLGSSYLTAQCPSLSPSLPAHSCIIGPAVINTHTHIYRAQKMHAEWCNCLVVSHAAWCNCLVSIACSVCVCVCARVCVCGRMHAKTHTLGVHRRPPIAPAGPPTWAAVISMNRFLGPVDGYVTLPRTKIYQSTKVPLGETPGCSGFRTWQEIDEVARSWASARNGDFRQEAGP